MLCEAKFRSLGGGAEDLFKTESVNTSTQSKHPRLELLRCSSLLDPGYYQDYSWTTEKNSRRNSRKLWSSKSSIYRVIWNESIKFLRAFSVNKYTWWTKWNCSESISLILSTISTIGNLEGADHLLAQWEFGLLHTQGYLESLCSKRLSRRSGCYVCMKSHLHAHVVCFRVIQT